MPRTKPPSETPLPTILVVGNGMVGARFCRQLGESGAAERHRVVVLGKEPRPAYDRVHLSNFARTRDAGVLELLPASWYEGHGIELRTGDPAVALDLNARRVTAASGRSVDFDQLVIATGSKPFVPPIPGNDLPGVFVYRTIEDMEAICSAAGTAGRAIVIGGGLLGIEAAQALQHLSVEFVTVIEAASFLMPQQLNEEAGRTLQTLITKQGIDVRVGARTKEIRIKKSGGLVLGMQDGSSLAADLIIIAAGVRPFTDWLGEEQFQRGRAGAIVVDDHLQTSEPGIFAIGECAEHRSRIYGLVAPGYEMADVLARRFAGKKKAAFTGADTSTRLKMLGVDVVTFRDALQPGQSLLFENDGVYRKLNLGSKQRLIGALGIGEWPESGLVQNAVNSGIRISDRMRNRFTSTGCLWGDESFRPVAQWDDHAVVCNCMNVCKAPICSAIAKGAATVEAITAATGAGSVCGSCQTLLGQLVGDTRASQPRYRTLVLASAAAFIAVVVTAFAPPVSFAESVTDTWYRVDVFWRDPWVKKVTGFSLTGICLMGLLLSLRKRFPWFSWGAFAQWRAFHAVFGVASLIALFVHTGFRFGHNLNFWLMLTFVLLNLLGALAGIVAALESRGIGAVAGHARQWRPVMTRLHLVLFWPFPVLLFFHVLSTLFY